MRTLSRQGDRSRHGVPGDLDVGCADTEPSGGQQGDRSQHGVPGDSDVGCADSRQGDRSQHGVPGDSDVGCDSRQGDSRGTLPCAEFCQSSAIQLPLDVQLLLCR